VALLVSVDRAHGCLSGPATVHLLRRACTCTVMRALNAWRNCRLAPVQPAQERPIPSRPGVLHQNPARAQCHWPAARATPAGGVGFIRIDSVHQGDLDRIKVYYVNAVDILTQWEVVACCERISEAFLLPVLEQLMAQFPFPIRGFHSDNGGEFVNRQVAPPCWASCRPSRPSRARARA
jgi:hypothetical protein